MKLQCNWYHLTTLSACKSILMTPPDGSAEDKSCPNSPCPLVWRNTHLDTPPLLLNVNFTVLLWCSCHTKNLKWLKPMIYFLDDSKLCFLLTQTMVNLKYLLKSSVIYYQIQWVKTGQKISEILNVISYNFRSLKITVKYGEKQNGFPRKLN